MQAQHKTTSNCKAVWQIRTPFAESVLQPQLRAPWFQSISPSLCFDACTWGPSRISIWRRNWQFRSKRAPLENAPCHMRQVGFTMQWHVANLKYRSQTARNPSSQSGLLISIAKDVLAVMPGISTSPQMESAKTSVVWSLLDFKWQPHAPGSAFTLLATCTAHTMHLVLFPTRRRSGTSELSHAVLPNPKHLHKTEKLVRPKPQSSFEYVNPLYDEP